MGRKSKLRKSAKIELSQLEKSLIEERARLRRQPTVKLALRVILVTLITVGLLYVGSSINRRLNNHFAGARTQQS